MSHTSFKTWFKSGSPWIWWNAAAVTVSLIMVFGLLALIAVRGMGNYWPANIEQWQIKEADGKQATIVGEIWDKELVSAVTLKESGVQVPPGQDHFTRYLLKVGNRDLLGSDFHLILEYQIESRSQPDDLVVIERREWGNAYGRLRKLMEKGQVIATGDKLTAEVAVRVARAVSLYDQIHEIEKDDIGAINYSLERLRLKQRRYELDGELTKQRQAEIKKEQTELKAEYAQLQQSLVKLYQDIKRDQLVIESMDGRTMTISLDKIVNVRHPNRMSLLDKLGVYFKNIGAFVSEDPREANTEGGVFPAIFGTVMMVMLMAVLVTPLGVVAAVYLREYAKQGFIIRTIRIAVNNLAGVPSIVYGVFGLGFFVYFLGGNIDRLFFPEAAPAPVFGTPGLLWSSLTLALLTLPVVIVATEEGLSRIPRSIREGSLALGATRFETLWRTIIPMASPAIMTGLILAIARAAGEVAPLMLVGVVKLAPSLPLDGNAPFLHLDRKFMHLGFHIYDVGFQSPNVEAARPLVYATALLLVLVIVALNLTAIGIRNHLREKYRSLES